MQQNYYQILGLTKTATQAEIKRAYRKLAKQYHPDSARQLPRKEAEERFKQINEAYSILSDPYKRKQHDYGHSGTNFGFRTYSSHSNISRREKIENKLAQHQNFSISQFATELRVDIANLVKILELMIRKGITRGKIVNNQFVHF